MENENLTPEEDIYDREDRCRRVIKNVTKAIVMRLLVVVLVVWSFTRAEPNPWLIGLMLLVVLVTASSLPILVKELTARRKELKDLINSEDE